jgi:hypothetical protein
MGKQVIKENEISDLSIRNQKERYAILNQDVINIRCPHGKYDPEIQETISARLALGKLEKVKQSGESVGMILHLKPGDLASLAQALSDSGFLEHLEKFYRETAGLDGFIQAGKDEQGRPLKILLKDTPADKAYQVFFSERDHDFWFLCLTYFTHITEEERKKYSFFISF